MYCLRILTAWDRLDQRVNDTAVGQWCTRLHTSVEVKGRHFEHKTEPVAYDSIVYQTLLNFINFICLFKCCTIKTEGFR